MPKKNKSRRGRSAETEELSDLDAFALEMADLIAGDDADGVFFGIYYAVLADPAQWGYEEDRKGASASGRRDGPHSEDDDMGLPF